jgi:hypothetical protein
VYKMIVIDAPGASRIELRATSLAKLRAASVVNVSGGAGASLLIGPHPGGQRRIDQLNAASRAIWARLAPWS